MVKSEEVLRDKSVSNKLSFALLKKKKRIKCQCHASIEMEMKAVPITANFIF